MRPLRTTIHPDLNPEQTGKERIFFRRAARGIILDNDNILLLYTEKYQDYTLPGGGIDEGESLHQGLIRELQEETGATNIRNIRDFGLYREYRPWYKDEYDALHMESYCYLCDIDKELGEARLEDYEQSNGMSAVWVNIYQAIAHNEKILARNNKKAMSVERETYLLKRIARELLEAEAKTVNLG
ncbi:NUDIX domain-containing protein [Thalassomonas actiniarum]|uniref:NUDIX domain-containing protein n=1 Tax=Thalassomonas actiniarum TaxID=485447 RepID=A0AAE9YQP8_9GAMM|nr:NUDIX hydrolase [Thalassomonas actiniarum]WDD97826.1 NUDIX domain-containing protein [Thalassomonas actiniarum]